MLLSFLDCEQRNEGSSVKLEWTVTNVCVKCQKNAKNTKKKKHQKICVPEGCQVHMFFGVFWCFLVFRKVLPLCHIFFCFGAPEHQKTPPNLTDAFEDTVDFKCGVGRCSLYRQPGLRSL